jgi:hypothetical protein
MQRACAGNPQKEIALEGQEVMEASMAGKLGPLSDRAPRDSSQMASNSHVSLYVGGLVVAIIVGCAVAYWYGLA